MGNILPIQGWDNFILSRKKTVIKTISFLAMKNLFIVLFFVSCTKANIDSTASSDAQRAHALETANHIGDPNRFPDLYIPEAETGWDDYLVYGIGQELLI